MPEKAREFFAEVEARMDRADELADRAAFPGGDGLLPPSWRGSVAVGAASLVVFGDGIERDALRVGWGSG